MQFVGMLTWWYTTGLLLAIRRSWSRLEGLIDYFSIDILIKTLFSPFRQIAAGNVNGPFPLMVRAFFDRLFSRGVGAVVRLIILFIGAIAIILGAILAFLYIIFWIIVPVLPIVGLVMTLTGWTPEVKI